MTDGPADRDEPLDRLARLAIARFGLRHDAALSLITRRENAVYRVEASGDRFALRLHRPGYQSAQSVRSELMWTDALRADGIETPEAVACAGGERVFEVRHPDVPQPHLCVLFPWLEGEPLDANDADAYGTLGAINARLHEHASHFVPPPGFVRQRWDEAGLFGPQATLGAFEQLQALGAAERALLVRAREAIGSRLRDFGKADDRFGLIHADMMPDNVLVDAGVPRVIDFDDCGFGWFAYDLATLLSMLRTRDDYPQLRDAWVRGYRSVRALPDEHLREVDALVLARQLVVVGWMHSRRETRAAAVATRWAIDGACEHARAFLAE